MQTRSKVNEGQTYAGASLAARYASFVKLPHTLFALPFAGAGAVLASWRHADNVTLASVGWIILAFTAARFAAMGFNRIVDRRYDAANPRTAQRELPSGRLTLTQAAIAVAAASAAFVTAAWMLNPLCGMLAPIALEAASSAGLSPHALLMAVAIAAAGSFNSQTWEDYGNGPVPSKDLIRRAVERARGWSHGRR